MLIDNVELYQEILKGGLVLNLIKKEIKMFQFKQGNFVIGLILLCASSTSNAELVNGNAGTITHFMVYATIVDGDFLVRTSSPLQGCYGFFVYGSDPGSKNVYAMLQMAYLTKKELWIWAESNQLWEGASDRYCHIYAIDYAEK